MPLGGAAHGRFHTVCRLTTKAVACTPLTPCTFTCNDKEHVSEKIQGAQSHP
jgi:hypothetical protein